MMSPRMIAPLAALTALATAQTAQAQQQACVAPADMADAITYAMPIAFDAVRTTCSNRLTGSGFIATRGEAYAAQFRARQTKAWPGAFRVLKSFMAGKDASAGGASPDIAAMLTGMPEGTIRPFVDGLIGQLIAEEIRPADCGRIERGLEVISPMPAENVGSLIAFVVELSDMKDPAICPVAVQAPSRQTAP